MNAAYWIQKLGLIPHPEGGYYRQTYRSDEWVSDADLSVKFGDKRRLATSIYFLLTRDEVSHFHRLKSDEIWYYHAGCPLTVYVIHPTGVLQEIRLGLNLDNGEVPQATVPRGTIFGSCMLPSSQSYDFSLVSCMVSPGFDFRDFELFSRDELLAIYPQHRDIIVKLTRAESAYAQLTPGGYRP
jgi:predicted cupin superfamily sugar epimerase